MDKVHQLTQQDKDAIKECITNFNFVQAADIINFMHEKYTKNAPENCFDDNYSGPGGYNFVARPMKTTAGELALDAERMLKCCLEEDLNTIQTGHLAVFKNTYTDDSGNDVSARISTTHGISLKINNRLYKNE